MEDSIGMVLALILIIGILIWGYTAERKFDYGDQEPPFISKLFFPKINNEKRRIKETIIKENIKRFKEISSKIIAKNINQLAIQREKSVIKDIYGKVNSENWTNKEIPYFIDNHIVPELLKAKVKIEIYLIEDLFAEIESKVKVTKLPFLDYYEKMNGFEFEKFCSDKLKKEGWETINTKKTGDQGIDIIVQKGNRKVGIQCKKYSKPIGNKAVQEVKAGLEFYKLDEGVVIGNTKFTKSAIELAQMNKVKLLHFLETDRI